MSEDNLPCNTVQIWAGPDHFYSSFNWWDAVQLWTNRFSQISSTSMELSVRESCWRER